MTVQPPVRPTPDPDEWEIDCPRCGMVLAECVCHREDDDSEMGDLPDEDFHIPGASE